MQTDYTRYAEQKAMGKAHIIKRGGRVALYAPTYDPATGEEGLPAITEIDPSRVAAWAEENRRIAGVLDLLHADATAALKSKRDVG